MAKKTSRGNFFPFKKQDNRKPKAELLGLRPEFISEDPGIKIIGYLHKIDGLWSIHSNKATLFKVNSYDQFINRCLIKAYNERAKVQVWIRKDRLLGLKVL